MGSSSQLTRSLESAVKRHTESLRGFGTALLKMKNLNDISRLKIELDRVRESSQAMEKVLRRLTSLDLSALTHNELDEIDTLTFYILEVSVNLELEFLKRIAAAVRDPQSLKELGLELDMERVERIKILARRVNELARQLLTDEA